MMHRTSRLALSLLVLTLAGCPDDDGGEPGLGLYDVISLADAGIGSPDGSGVTDTGGGQPDALDAADGQDAAEPVGQFGDPCKGNADCLSGWCVASDEGAVCTKLCIDDCPEGWGCVGVTNTGADVTFICLPTDTHLCEPCVVDQQCGEGLCVELSDGRACSRPCDDDTCPAGFACVDPPAGAPEGARRQCVPESGSCSCNEKTVGAVRPCSRSSELGTCWGTETCGDAGWSACSATVPAPEDCNGKDDDCDGLADEDLTAPAEPCQHTNDAGTCAGVWTCGSLAGWVCNAATPAPETCNYADDDCDGQVDEDFRDASGAYSGDLHCGACGQECASLFPGATAGCVSGDVGPKCAITACPDGFFKANDVTCLPIQSSLCLPCKIDANCAVPGDLCLEIGGGTYCGRSCGAESPHGPECPEGYACEAVQGASQCVPVNGTCDCLPQNAGMTRSCKAEGPLGACYGSQTCDPAAGWGPCSAAPPAAEECNGLDDDCDGLVDDGLSPPSQECESASELGVCTGAWQCAGAAGWLCGAPPPTVEACNYKDDDCDGQVDEDFRDGAGAYVDPGHCGQCEVSCAAFVPNGTGGCVADGETASCVVTGCNPGYYPAGGIVCLPVADTSCQPCAGDASCLVPGNRCLSLDGGSFCGRDCGPGNAYGSPAGVCPAGFTCTDPDGLGAQCVPDTGSCTCRLPGHLGSTRTCVETSEAGICLGTQACAADGWQSCKAPTPTPEVCNGKDDDCDGSVDEGVVEPEEQCQTTWVDPLSGESTCSGQWACLADLLDTQWRCLAPIAGPEVCNYADDDCDGLVDEDFRDSATGTYAHDGHCGLCGFACAGALPHATAACVLNGGAASCAVVACEPGYYQAGASACLPVKETACQPCASDTACVVPGNRCLALDGGSYCGRDCGPGNAYGTPAGVCPDGYECVGQSEPQCVPSTGSCTCHDASQEGAARSCVASNAFGQCLGAQTCGEAGWSPCSAPTPAAEECNGKDDDCDGQVDEGVTEPSAPCEQSNADGTCVATWICTGAGWQCPAATPTAEACNYGDDDCDGVVDDGFRDPATGAYVNDDHCGVCGNSCDGSIAYAVSTACSLIGNKATCVATACDVGYFLPVGGPQICVPLSGGFECSPCVGDGNCTDVPGGACTKLDGGGYCTRSCDGPADCSAGYACTDGRCIPTTLSCTCMPDNTGATRTCYADNAYGVCFGIQTCHPAEAPGWSPCTTAVPMEETCNGKDDNCNGLVDEAVLHDPKTCAVTNGFGSCGGAWVCGGVAGWTCMAPTPAAETCNYQDDDCDGLVDEPFRVGGTGAYVGDDHCGTCGVSCDGAIPSATATCAANGGKPRCEVASCDVGTYQVGALTCLPAEAAVCLPCLTDANCPTPGDACVPFEDGGFCGRDCGPGNLYGTPEGQCPAGTACQAVGATKQCVPTTGSCTCLPGQGGATRTCFAQGAEGTCFGQQTCGAGGWGVCSAATPTVEVCNGIDDDCDGLVDDVAGRGAPCSVTNEHGTCGGVNDCAPGNAALTCVGPAPAAETCNGKDDDCDGVIDEPFLVGGKLATFEHCGACGSSCASAIPNATATCDASGTIPTCVVASCAPGFVKLGPTQCVPAELGLCEPCASDASCIVPDARCLPLDDGTFCANPCPEGACPSGYSCTALTGGSFCVPNTQACTCKGTNLLLQKGCFVTYDPPDAPAYPCLGTQSCTVTGWSQCVPGGEQCNLLDDDCDGMTDEDFLSANGAYDTDQNCGACGNNCTLLTFPGGGGVCNTFVDPPVCSLGCTGSCFDVNANPTDGCECCDPEPVDLPDEQGVDSNCDGIDGERDNGIFVSKEGDDLLNDGSIGAPKRTIQAGIDAAVAQGKRDVYVATGVYVEAVLLAPGIGVYGGYSADFVQRNRHLYEAAILAPLPTPSLPGGVNAVGITAQGAVFDGFTVFGAHVKAPGASSYAVVVQDCDAALRISNTVVVAGSGGKGQRGTDGVSGSPGAGGGAGKAALDLYFAYGVSDHNCTAAHHSAGGVPGTGSCGATTVSGGAGGIRVCPALDPVSGAPMAPVPSENGATGSGGALGGPAGQDTYHQAYQCDGYSTFGVVEGGNGADGAGGTLGASGAGCTDTDGSVVGGLFLPAAAGNGTGGSAGGGGGGGGSGGGAWVHNSCFSKGFGWDNLGGTGGGGGAGGCGGTHGTAGTSGGGAFGIFVTWSAPLGSAPILSGNTLFGGVGGDGGDGGNGGTGGAGGGGGAGGAGGGTFNPVDPTYPAFEGGKGGKGGNGGHGGGGGGGCGGPAFGIFTAGLGGDLGAWKTANSFATAGVGGDGGRGGFSLGEPGGDGSGGAASATSF
ncbi:MAG: hypothetical protein AMXMBFR64_07620 [Myxococcales bacterium]